MLLILLFQVKFLYLMHELGGTWRLVGAGWLLHGVVHSSCRAVNIAVFGHEPLDWYPETFRAAADLLVGIYFAAIDAPWVALGVLFLPHLWRAVDDFWWDGERLRITSVALEILERRWMILTSLGFAAGAYMLTRWIIGTL